MRRSGDQRTGLANKISSYTHTRFLAFLVFCFVLFFGGWGVVVCLVFVFFNPVHKSVETCHFLCFLFRFITKYQLLNQQQ